MNILKSLSVLHRYSIILCSLGMLFSNCSFVSSVFLSHNSVCGSLGFNDRHIRKQYNCVIVFNNCVICLSLCHTMDCTTEPEKILPGCLITNSGTRGQHGCKVIVW